MIFEGVAFFYAASLNLSSSRYSNRKSLARVVEGTSKTVCVPREPTLTKTKEKSDEEKAYRKIEYGFWALRMIVDSYSS